MLDIEHVSHRLPICYTQTWLCIFISRNLQREQEKRAVYCHAEVFSHERYAHFKFMVFDFRTKKSLEGPYDEDFRFQFICRYINVYNTGLHALK